ncbi:lactonase family protein [Spirosoma sp. KUDC1026]|uniref:lactonase family protein n=1 Tax=Spirosoma sp. KUDC1026 TaxID=2745947 RepID=UPI00159BC248|nr:lactonase family protein [Spirosoma sp. KUDC1026]QKZ12060.1 lactonase family protein [Spirosoma sp. KUDC1026]
MKRLLVLSLLGVMNYLSALAQKEIIYVGTYSVRGSEGIYVYEFDRKTGKMQQIQTIGNSKSPSFLALHPSGNYLYSVNEGSQSGPNKAGAVSAYAIDAKTGKLTFLNSQSSLGSGPCHVSIDRTGKTVFVSNYGGGSLAVLPVLEDGKLAAASDSVIDVGNGPDKQRQEKPHVHSAILSPSNKTVYVSDLGTDQVNQLRVNALTATVESAKPPFVAVKPGSGPRHLTFHPNGQFAYLAEELTSSVAVFRRNTATDELSLVQDGVKTLSDDFNGKNTSADIHVDPMGKFLYQSNRGENTLAIFAIDQNGMLTKVGSESTMGKDPRNFLIDPKGNYLFAANQNSDNIVLFRRDAKTGKLTYSGQTIAVPSPVCVLIKNR